MLNKILEKIKKENLIANNDKIVLGFSGGPDSVFLLEILNELKKYFSFEIILAHVNHLLRGENSNEDEKFCIKCANKFNLKIFTKRIAIDEVAKIKNIGLEEAGRDIRYEFFQEILEEVSGNKIAIAHNLDDQIENFLFRMMRGTSLEGLEGIPSKDNIIRPINEIYKKDILYYLNEKNIEYRLDESNFENEFTRNSIRLDLIPFIEKRYNKNFKEKIFNLINEIKTVNEILEIDLNKYLKNDEIKEYLDVKLISVENNFLQKKIINKILKKYNIESSREKIKNILKLFHSEGSKSINFENDFIIKKEYEKIWIEKWSEKNNYGKNILSGIIKKIPFKENFNDYILEAEEYVPDGNNMKFGKNEFLTNLKVGDIIEMRTRNTGDKIKPLGMNSLKKVKDILINEKIPKDKREEIPIIINENKIVWIAGIKKSEDFKCEKNKVGIKLVLRRQDDK